MTPDSPDATAWERIRETVKADATNYRDQGDTVIEVFADHSTVRQPTDQPVTFSYTVPGDTISDLQQHVTGGLRLHTEIKYVDVEGTRLYVLDVRAEGEDLTVLIAGGVRSELLQEFTDERGPARTVVRSVSGTVPLELRHDSVEPFLTGLD